MYSLSSLSFCAHQLIPLSSLPSMVLILELTFVLLCAMLFQRFAPAASTFNSALYITGGSTCTYSKLSNQYFNVAIVV